PGPASGRHGEVRRDHDTHVATVHCGLETLAAVGHLLDGHGSADEGDPVVVAQVLAGQPPTEDVVDRDRAAVPLARAAVDQHHRRPAVHQVLDPAVATTVNRRDQHALHALLLQQVEVAPLAVDVLSAVADHHDRAGRLNRGLGSPYDVGEERVGHVEDDDGHRTAAAGTQLT